MKTLAIINQKGGVGKSTTALAIGEALILKGYKVLFVDLDAQGNLSYTLGADLTQHNVLRALQRPDTAEQEIQHTSRADIISSSSALTGADTLFTEVGKEYKLKEALESLSTNYDYCIIDTPPALSILTVNALVASNAVVIPAQADIYSLQGISQLNNTIQTVKKYCNPSLQILGIVLTRYSGRAIISREVAEMIEGTAGQLGTKLFNTKVRECTALKEAQAMKQSIFDYAPRSNASADYLALIEEIL